MERRLLLLGLLQAQQMYGYQLTEVIDMHLGASIDLKKPTIYKLLNQMAEDGWLSYHEEQEGKRPPRRVYAITPDGKAAFIRLLREKLVDYQPVEFWSDIGIGFMDALPSDEVLPLLQQRNEIIQHLLSEIQTTEVHPGSMQLMIEHQERHLRAELEWLAEVMNRIKDGQYATKEENQ